MTVVQDLDGGARPPRTSAGSAWFAGVHADGVLQTSDDPAVLASGGFWAVVVTFEGAVRLWRLARRRPAARPPAPDAPWTGPARNTWRSSLDEQAYVAGVEEVRRRIREGEVYQANLCRVLEAPVAGAGSPWGLAARLHAGNPAPHAAVLDLPWPGDEAGTRIVSASPELFLRVDGDLVESAPIKGTAPSPAGLLPKDEAENVMIVDLVRNDLQRVCRPGTVEVPRLLDVERHPGLVHLVSAVRGRLTAEPWGPDGGAAWRALLAATAPAGSVSGAPKSSALRVIADLEPVPRGPYCGAIGWVDADRRRASLAVGIRTFWWEGGLLRFGTGAGITWGSDPQGEWAETELKAARLVGLASTTAGGDASGTAKGSA